MEEVLQALCLQDGPQALAAGSACVGSITTSTASEIDVTEIQSCDGAAALADEQRAGAVSSSVAGANPAQWDDLSITRKVVCLDVLQRDNQAFYKRIAEGKLEEVGFIPVVLTREYLPAAKVDNIYTRQLLY